jgi:3'-5' exoribonuclease Rv2179c-like domain
METKKNIIVSLDTEFESQNIITGNCLQLAFVAFYEDCENLDLLDTSSWIVSQLSLCFKDQNKKKDQDVMKWWEEYPEIYQKIYSEAIDLPTAMQKLQCWLNMLSEKYNIKNFLADHSCIDFPWFKNLYLTHCDQNLNKFRLPWTSICIDNMKRTLIIIGIKEEDITNYCTHEKFKHTHYALDDALECAFYYIKLKEFIIKNINIVSQK